MRRAGLDLVTNNGDIAGGEQMLFAVAAAARELGERVRIVAPSRPGEVLERARAEGFPVLEIRARSRPAYLLGLALGRPLLRRRVWCNGLLPAVALAGQRRRVVHLHQVPRGRQALLARVAQLGAERVVVPSQYLAQRLAEPLSERGGGPAVPWPLRRLARTARRGGQAPDTEVLPPPEILPNWVRQVPAAPLAAPAGDGAPVHIGYLGRLAAEKGVDRLARAVAALADAPEGAWESAPEGAPDGTPEGTPEEIGPLVLHVAGAPQHVAPDSVARVESALAALAAADPAALLRHGRIPPEQLYPRIHLLVVPSDLGEVFGLVAAEAMGAGVPVVVSDDGGLPEVVGPEHPWVFRAGDQQDLERVLAQAVAAVRREPAAVAQAVQAAQRRWRTELAPENGRRRLTRLLEGLR